MNRASAADGRRWRPWVLAAAAGVALALALPGLRWWPLALLTPGLLLAAIRRSGVRRAVLIGWFGGVVHWSIAVGWVMSVLHVYGGLPWIAAFGSVVLMAMILGAGWAAVAAATAAVPAVWRPWMLPAAWIAMEAVWRYQPWRFPWNPVASVLTGWPVLLGSLPVWGASGLGWTVLALGAGLAALVLREGRKTAAAVVATALAGVVIASLVAPPPSLEGAEVTVAMIQPGISQHERWDPSMWRETSERVFELTAEAAARGARMILWPEGAVAYRLETDAAYAERVARLASMLDVEIVLNSIGTTADGGYANSAYVVTADGVSPLRYDKVKLVPFGEYVPGWASLLFSESLVREVGRFEPGAGPVTLPARVPAAVAICYEVVFPDLIAAQVRDGAQLLLSLTNDGWYGDSWAPRQHWAQAVLRAVETRRWLVRGALSGISGAIDPVGRAHGRMDVGESGVSIVDVRGLGGLTPRVRWGDWWTVLCAIAVVVLLVGGNIRGRSTVW
jgi:apolipoprotein N-acyltransferase